MIKILVIDDDATKRSRIVDFILSKSEIVASDVAIASNLVEARSCLSREIFDLVILDICLPSMPGDDPIPNAGIQFVREMRISSNLMKPGNIIGLTSFDKVLLDATEVFRDELWQVVKYDPTSNSWSLQIGQKIAYLLRSKIEATIDDYASDYDYDLAIVTALWDPEMKAVLNLPLKWERMPVSKDGSVYFSGSVSDNGINIRVIAASCSQMGIAPAAVLAMKMINHFRPRYLAICGIAAGVTEAHLNFGDILIAEQSWDYESGKRRINPSGQPVLVPDPHYILISTDLRDKFAECIGSGKYVSSIRETWKGPEAENTLRAILGPVASGAAVVQDYGIVANVKEHARKLIGIEMETYGVYYACHNCSKPRPQSFAIKSVVDFADDKKGNDYQSYAAFTSAQYLWHFALDHIGRSPTL